MKIGIIDDESDIREILEFNLQKEGYETFTAENGKIGIQKCIDEKPALIILDVMMPEMDGMEVCEILRKTLGQENLLICFLTARNEDYSQIAGLDAGADDYIAKPIKPKVLLSRINAILRRKSNAVLEDGRTEKLIVDRDKYIVLKEGKSIQLPRKEFELLSLIASKPETVFEREYILEKVWGSDVVVGDRTIDVHIRKLREKIGEEYIQTVKGIGYKFIPQF